MGTLRSLAVGGLVLVVWLGGCAPQTRVAGTIVPAQSSTTAAPSGASARPIPSGSQPPLTPQGTETPESTVAAVDDRVVRDSLKGRDTQLTFHLVADLPEAIEFAPLGSDSLLVAGYCEGPQPLLIEANQLRFLPELAGGVQRKSVMSCASSIGGTWPGNTWAALSSASDAGPSSSDVYQWVSGRGWVLRHEYAPWVFELVPWRGNMVFLSKCRACAVPQRPGLAVRSSSGKWLKVPQPLGYQLPGETVAPAWVHAGTLSLFGYELGPFEAPPQDGSVLLMETWTGAGKKTLRRLPLSKGQEEVIGVVLSEDGWVAWLPSSGQAPPRLARFVENGWATVAELPSRFAALSSPASGGLWGIVDGYLLFWNDQDWDITELPRDAKFTEISWQSVWRRGPKDIWLIGTMGSKPARYLLFNTADGKTDRDFPSESERERLRPVAKNEDQPDEPPTCPNPYADFLKLTPFQLGFDSDIEMSPMQARRALEAVLTRHPEFRHLDFRQHGCYGENCVGAVVRSVEEALRLRKELEATIGAIVQADTSNHGPPATWLLSYDNLRCLPPPETTPFPVPR